MSATSDVAGGVVPAASMNCVKGSQIMDSSENDSAVVTVTGSFAAGANNKELPLKTAAKSYRFFAYTLASQGATDYNAENIDHFILDYTYNDQVSSLLLYATNKNSHIFLRELHILLITSFL